LDLTLIVTFFYTLALKPKLKIILAIAYHPNQNMLRCEGLSLNAIKASIILAVQLIDQPL
jgi:hypothetical protein